MKTEIEFIKDSYKVTNQEAADALKILLQLNEVDKRVIDAIVNNKERKSK